MAKIDLEYGSILEQIVNYGYEYEDPNRKGVIRKEIPTATLRYDLSDGTFPAITLKKLYWKGVVGELLWFLSGDTNIEPLHEMGIHFWDKDFERWQKSPNYSGDLGRIYGAQWRNFRSYLVAPSQTSYFTYSVDQISTLIKNLIEKPLATDHIVTAWNPTDRNYMALDPCHFMFQVVVYPIGGEEKYGFDFIWSQRSSDIYLGIPINIASYALLAKMLEKITGYKAMTLIGDLRNVHLYDNQIDAAKELLLRMRENKYPDARLKINSTDTIFKMMASDFDSSLECLSIDDFELEGYDSYPNIKVLMLTRDE